MTRRLLEKLLRTIVGRRRIQALRRLALTATIHGQRPAVLEPAGGRIMVLAPHMDDEVLGCGGTIARHVRAGAEVGIVFLTDGRYGMRSDDTKTELERRRQQSLLVDIRKQEAQQAGEILGVNNLTFLDAEDGALHANAALPGRLRAVLERESPSIVYLPFFLENHIDHSAATDLLIAATHGSRQDFECRCYEVWTPLFPNIVVQIDATIELKQSALNCYRSQLETMDYAHTCLGLNAYRSSAIGSQTARFVEAFYALPLDEYRRLHRRVRRFL